MEEHMALRRPKTKSGSPSGEGKRTAEAGAELHEQIARRAYELYEQRGRQHGNDVADWLQAEEEIHAGVVSMTAVR
jgi:Protein of unknown function (DUF2934)